MIKLGKVYGNRMIDLSVSNDKLLDRALRILKDVADMGRDFYLDIYDGIVLQRGGQYENTMLG